MDIEKLTSQMPYLNHRKSVDGIASFDCSASHLLRTVENLRNHFEFQSLNDIASIDMGEDLTQFRFGAVYHFFSHTKKCYIRIRAMAEDVQTPVLPSICSIYKGADWLEREAFDLMGIVFENHPNLHRILMWDTYPWHPLRKDFPLAGREAPLPETFEGNENITRVIPAPENGGPFHSPSCGVEFVAEREPRSIDGQCEGIENI